MDAEPISAARDRTGPRRGIATNINAYRVARLVSSSSYFRGAAIALIRHRHESLNRSRAPQIAWVG